MTVKFIILGRLGNAIFRYMACAIMCIITNTEYSSSYSYYNNSNDISDSTNDNFNLVLTDDKFLEVSRFLLTNYPIPVLNKNMIMNGFYQHDSIYKKYKNEIMNFINNHPEHIVITDGINSGDGNKEAFKMFDILNTPINFKKIYKNVIHLRLEDFVTHNLYLPVERILSLLNKNIITDSICIVCKKPTTKFEFEYIKTITDFLKEKYIDIDIKIENNDVLTDYYIMKEAELLICSQSTLVWSAAFFSNKNKICYSPNYIIPGSNMTCKFPTENTILY
jgi:hypothetical protein